MKKNIPALLIATGLLSLALPGTFGGALKAALSERHYLDVALADLNPTHDNKRICVYGNYSAGDEHNGFESLVSVRPGSFADYIVSLKKTAPESSSAKAIGCGVITHSVDGRGYGHMGQYEFLLNVEIITNAGDEAPFSGKINTGADCRKVPGSNRRDICYWDLAIKDKNAGMCKLIGARLTRDSCLLHLANSLSQSQICLRISSGTSIDLFYENSWHYKDLIRETCYVLSNSSAEDCQRLSDQRLQDKCLAKTAVNAKDQAVCRKIKDYTTRGFCYADLAIKLNDLSVCEKLPEGQFVYPDGSGELVTEQSHCYWCYVARTRDYKVCDRIKDESNKISCQAIY